METYQKCLQILKSNQSDSEKLAALMVVSKLSSSLTLDEKNVCDLFHAVTPTFLMRLIKSKPNQSDDTSKMLKDVAISIISLFVQLIPDVVLKEEQIFKEIFATISEDHHECIDAWIDIIVSISYHDKGRSLLLDFKLLSVFQNLILEAEKQEKVYILLSNLLVKGHQPNPTVVEFILKLSEEFKITQELVKFQYVNVLDKLFSLISAKMTVDYKDDCYMKILKNIADGCGDIMQSRVKSDQKRSVIMLISKALAVFGVEWIFDGKCIEKNAKFIILTLTVISIELACLFQENPHNIVLLERKDLINAFFDISVKVLQFLCSDTFEQHNLSSDSKFILNAFNCLKNIMKTTYENLELVNVESVKKLDDPVLMAALSMVCVWATEETEHLREELRKIIPLIVKVGTLDFEENVRNGKPTHLLHAMSPCVAQLLPDDAMRKVLIRCKCQDLYIRYFCCVVQSKQTEMVCLEAVNSTIHILYQLLLLEPKHCYESTLFDELVTSTRNIIHDFLATSADKSEYTSFEMIALLFTLLRLKSYEVDSIIQTLTEASINFIFNEIDSSVAGDLKDIWIIAAQNIMVYVTEHEKLYRHLKTQSLQLFQKTGPEYEDYKNVFKQVL